MAEQAPENALARIESALARIERAAMERTAGDPELERRHARLRAKVAGAIAAIDHLIDRPSPDSPAPDFPAPDSPATNAGEDTD
ncbi:MAG TPA: hypothetical protein VNR91_12370 [Sphingomonas sp.]|nr:hypothetical protein [Sphingomonas sp.]